MALALEKEVNRSLLDIHQLCSTLDDPQVSLSIGFANMAKFSSVYEFY